MNKVPDFRVFAAITGVIVLGGSGLMYSQYSTLTEEQNKEVALRGELKNETELKKMLVDSMTKLTATRERLAHLEKGVPDYAYLATMLKDLSVFGKQSGITIAGVTTLVRPKPVLPEGTKPEKKPYVEQDIEVLGKGSYGDALRFVQSLDKFPKVVAARTVTMQPKISAHDEHALDITISLRAFLFPADKPKQPDTKTAMRTSNARQSGGGHEG